MKNENQIINPVLANILVNIDKAYRDMSQLDDEVRLQYKDNPEDNPYKARFAEASSEACNLLVSIENLISIDIINRVNNSSKQ